MKNLIKISIQIRLKSKRKEAKIAKSESQMAWAKSVKSQELVTRERSMLL